MKKRIIVVSLILILCSIFLFGKDTIMNNIKEMTADVTKIYNTAESNNSKAKSTTATWHTVTIIPAGSYAGNIISAKVIVGDTVNGYKVTSVNGMTIKVKVFGKLYDEFIIPSASELWNGAIKSDYVWWAGTGSSQKTEGNTALLPQNNASAYYYFNTPKSVGGNDLWSFTLKYDANGGYGAPTDQTYATNDKYEKGHQFTVSTQKPTRDGYTFLGWSKEKNATSPSYYPNDSYFMINPVSGYAGGAYEETLYAVWEEIGPMYKVIYTDGVDGKTLFPDQGYESLKLGDKTPEFEFIGNPTREDYEFVGWLLSTNKSKPINVNPIVSADDADENNDIIYIAQWEKKPEYTINDLDVTKKASNITLLVGEEFKYIINIRNSNENGVIVDISDVLPDSLTFISASNGGIEKDGIVTWKDILVPGRDSKEVTLTVKANQATTIENTATISFYDLTKPSNKEVVNAEENPKYTVIYKDEDNSFIEQRQGNLHEGENTPKFKEEPGKTEILEEGTIIPIREGYRFIGWSKKINKVVSAKDANENYEIIYIAKWQKMGETTDKEENTTPTEDKKEDSGNKKNSSEIENPLTEDKIIKYLISGTISTLLLTIIILKNRQAIKNKLNS